jgi:general secretion pathway protein C
MRLTLDQRARRMLRRVPHTTAYSAVELILITLVAVQCARLIWIVATPVDPVGAWRAGPAPIAVPSPLGGFDPFFRLSGSAAPVAVTSLALTLHGVRENRASGGGSAIIGTPDGLQRSYAVGEEIAPGVTLSAVGYDSITLSRAGTAEQLFLDQSVPAAEVAPAPPAAPPLNFGTPATPPPATPPAPVPAAPAADLMRAAGLQPGDQIVSVAGQPVSSPEQASSLASGLRGREVPVVVRRNGAETVINARIPQ